jgi:hypothetical protein
MTGLGTPEPNLAHFDAVAASARTAPRREISQNFGARSGSPRYLVTGPNYHAPNHVRRFDLDRVTLVPDTEVVRKVAGEYIKVREAVVILDDPDLVLPWLSRRRDGDLREGQGATEVQGVFPPD